MTLSLLELRHIIESGFLPLACRCTSDASGHLTIEIIDPESGNNLVVGGIAVASLNTSRAIAELIGQLRAEFNMAGQAGKRWHVV
jgi:hypothetical protein